MSKHILVIGAGLSSTYLIEYLKKNAAEHDWQITIADSNYQLALSKAGDGERMHATTIQTENAEELNSIIAAHDIVISLLPPALHVTVAKVCLQQKKHLITASYVSEEMQKLHTDALKNNLLFLNECGLDPGIDHLSAMKMIDNIHRNGGVVNTFKSYCGGLVAPEYDNNPWHYKFTWNPRNVVLAGQATARYLEEGELKFIGPSRIFTQTENIEIKGSGSYESYANRDSLGYIGPYGIKHAGTVLRGTLRKKGFCNQWNMLAKIGLTDDTFIIPDSEKITYRQLLSALIPGTGMPQLEKRVCAFLGITPDSSDYHSIAWLGLFTEERAGISNATPAKILQYLLERKWALEPNDLDMIVMYHYLAYTLRGEKHQVSSSLVVKGESQSLTAMAKTVGLPLGIASKLVLENRVKSRGVQIPLQPEYYLPTLDELETFGIRFEEHHS
jgi:saccharopine dehydrogenase (NADP+, L-glutamate forming)